MREIKCESLTSRMTGYGWEDYCTARSCPVDASDCFVCGGMDCGYHDGLLCGMTGRIVDVNECLGCEEE